MMKKKLQDAFNAQINEELYSAYLYAAMRAAFESMNLKGYANWMRLQVEEELFHARKFMEFIFERGGEVELKAIKQPQAQWDSPLAMFEAAYRHECHISECINKLSTLAMKEDDHAARIFLEWFVTEQVEEEANADGMVQNLKLMKDAPGGLFMLDREAGQRVISPLVLASITGAAAGA
ncbi:MAG TPA: ferritin [Candidatus Hydrogenedentes bacterium]|nr:ferritin [Candidatus Hydrogenedentota bacterium]